MCYFPNTFFKLEGNLQSLIKLLKNELKYKHINNPKLQ